MAIIVAIFFSCGDPCTDLGMAYTFLMANYATEAYMVVVTDYIPVILTLTHFFMATVQNRMTRKQSFMFAMVLIVMNPFLPPICHFMWLVCRMSGNKNNEAYCHYLAKLTQGISGAFEVRIFLVQSIK